MNSIDGIQDMQQNELCPSVCDNQNEEKIEYVWQIENFSMCPQRNGESLRSTEFSVNFVNESKLLLKLYPRGRDDSNSENVLCYLDTLNEFDYYINADISLIESTGSAFFTKTKKGYRISKSSETKFILSYSRQDLFLKKAVYLPHDILTVRCIIKPFCNSNFCCDAKFLTLSKDLSKLFNSSIHSDLEIRYFGHKFSVHKFILAARAPYLAKFMGFIDDNTIKTVSLNRISIPALQPLLSYLYSGKLQEDLSPMVLDELFLVANTFNIDHLKNEILPSEISTVARTVINTRWRLISYTIENFSKRMLNGKWPVHTFIDLTIGKFTIAISMKKDSSNNSIEINIQNKSILITGCIFLKCKVFLNKGHGENNSELCAGVHWFEQTKENSNLEFTMIGDASMIYSNNTSTQYPDALELAFDFSVSHSESDERSLPEEIKASLTNPRPSFRRSCQKLCADMDIIWKNACLNSEHNVNNSLPNFTDINVTFKTKAIQCHKAILAARSKTLCEILALNISENDHCLVLDDFREEILHDLFHYMYSGKTKRCESIEDLYDAAVKYRISLL